MVLGDSYTLSNGLRLCVDWLSWTLTEPCSVSDAITQMGYLLSDFRQLPTGLNGYRSRMQHVAYPISVQYDGKPEMGIHIDVSGSAISDLLTHFHNSRLTETPFQASGYEVTDFDDSLFRDLLEAIRENGHITRLDLAIDDIGACFYTMPDIHAQLVSGAFVSKFQTWDERTTYRCCQSVAGWTIYLGSRYSETMLRIYDKQLEQNKKLLAAGCEPIMNRWIRWELELKRERATQAVDRIQAGLSIAEVSMGILSNYLRFIQLDNERKDRCTTLETWAQFIDGVAKLKLYQPGEPRTLDTTRNWLLRQVAPSFATVIHADGGCTDFINSLLTSGTMRMNSHQRELIESELEKGYDA